MPIWRNWQEPSDYAFIEKCRPELVAWEFLRRNPEYQQDRQWFISLWNELEQEYGSPPNRDFSAWKKDPRAYRSEREIYNLKVGSNVSGNCASQDDNLLIECWMGTKWGFYKFPIEPNKDNPTMGEDLTWRASSVNVKLINEDNISQIDNTELKNKAAIVFELNKNLKEQIQSAKQLLTIAQKNSRNLNNNTQEWILYLRILDANYNGENESGIQKILNLEPDLYTIKKQQALNLEREKYREIINFI